MARKPGVEADPIKERLTELFGSDEADVNDKYDTPEPLEYDDFFEEKNVLIQLKSLVYSIDWEIKEEYLFDLISEAEHLMDGYKDDKHLVILFQMLISLAKYVLKRKVDSHPESINLLKEIYQTIERLSQEEHISDYTKSAEVSALLTRFKGLKEAIKTKASLRAERETRPVVEESKAEKEAKVKFPYEKTGEVREVPESEGSSKAGVEGVVKREALPGMQPHEAFLYALEEIKELIRGEMKAIRAELRLWRESLR